MLRPHGLTLETLCGGRPFWLDSTFLAVLCDSVGPPSFLVSVSHPFPLLHWSLLSRGTRPQLCPALLWDESARVPLCVLVPLGLWSAGAEGAGVGWRERH